jgi:hypothetical protein
MSMALGTLTRGLCLLSLLGCWQARSQAQVSYRIDNHIGACLEPVASQVTWVRGLLVLELRYRMTQASARCGCKSAVTSFASHAEQPSGQRLLVSGSVTLAHNDLVSLPVAVDRDLLGAAPVVVSLGCEPAQ